MAAVPTEPAPPPRLPTSAKDHFRVPESEKQEGLAAIVASKAEVLNG